MDESTMEWVLKMLYTAKHLYDVGRLDDLIEDMENFAGDGEKFVFDPEWGYFFHELAISMIFDRSANYYNEEDCSTTWVFWDKAMYRYYQLCKLYEAREGIVEVENPYLKKAEEAIGRAMTFGCNDYNYCWYTDISKENRCKLVWIEGAEFCHIYEVPEGLIDLKTFFQEGVRTLEAELTGGKVIQLPLPAPIPEQEAA